MVELIVNTNTYISVADADAYFDDRLFSDTWDNTDADTKAKALIMATKKIDRLPIIGRKAIDSQTLQFPRMIYSYNRDNLFNSYFVTQEGNKYITNSIGWYTEDFVSNRVKYATCEEALALLERGNSKRIKLQQQNVKSFSLGGGISETYGNRIVKILSEEAQEYLQPYRTTSIPIF
ncbi:DnaT-like ssDNA-binding protein [Clostridium pasteurianum]|uniref:Putative DnaT-like domain-containing protein n=1 Tax=Clostridium pasteurianum BC1 TaxID=86416 RepID=R4K2S0_CLOPA|nr:DnaT-like ssDNA-binding protein [Clostridium pasteurianum]AGK97407.1 hypothetical protein Clopa_2547 [Clostridium pasteurianum BC1]